MRITGGTHRGRALTSPTDQTIRPTSDRARLAIFNMLDARGALKDARVLDLFCGTGALGLEALSRGAAQVRLIDSARTSLDLARQNADKLKLSDRCRFDLTDAATLPPRKSNDPAATLVFLDPPYRKALIPPTLARLTEGNWLAPGAVLVVETEQESPLQLPAELSEIQHRVYGQAAIWLLQTQGVPS